MNMNIMVKLYGMKKLSDKEYLYHTFFPVEVGSLVMVETCTGYAAGVVTGFVAELPKGITYEVKEVVSVVDTDNVNKRRERDEAKQLVLAKLRGMSEEDLLYAILNGNEEIEEMAERLDEEIDEGRWVPVKERLPREAGEYLIVSADGLRQICDFRNGAWVTYGAYAEEHKVKDVTAWRVIPPFPGEKEDIDADGEPSDTNCGEGQWVSTEERLPSRGGGTLLP